MSKNKQCIVCGTKYEYCGNCDGNRKQNTWKLNYCSENCRDIFRTVTDYIGKNITIKEAKEKLNKLDLNKNRTEQINKYIVTILAYGEPKPKKVEVKEDNLSVSDDESKEQSKRVRRRRTRKLLWTSSDYKKEKKE